MKRLLTFVSISLIVSGAYCQDVNDNQGSFYSQPYNTRNSGSFGKSFRLFSLAVGFPNRIVAANNAPVYSEHSGLNPLIASMELSISDAIGIAPQIAVYSVKFTDYIGGVDKVMVYDLSTMGMYHFNKLVAIQKLDLYAGLGLTLSITRFQWNVGRIRANNLVSSGTSIAAGFLGAVGGRYYVTRKFAVFAEAGIPRGCFVDIGITLTSR